MAGVARNASKVSAGALQPASSLNTPQEELEEVVSYDRSMSPVPIDMRALRHDDQQLQLVVVKDDLRSLVSIRFCRHRYSET